MNAVEEHLHKPAILAPAGNTESFLAAVAAGADAVYCGLKQFSARMEAKNFALEELIRLSRFAHDKGVGVYIALNSLLKTEDLKKAAILVAQLEKDVKPDALIIQDLSLIRIAGEAGYTGELHLSTLANVSFPSALKFVTEKMGVDRVVIPRELNIDEIKGMADACPTGLELEIFVHGALCYGVSGRCYWSSFLGGKSGLRGQCVQPCRRWYLQEDKKEKFFSCRDYSIDVLAKVLHKIPQIAAWKIEGRKKGPHYVYYTVQAYRILRDEADDPQSKKTALGLLERSLGRPGTHYFFLPQRPYNPIETGQQTGSGLLMGKLTLDGPNSVLRPNEALLTGDTLRVGYENESWHQVLKIRQAVPKRGRLVIKPEKGQRPVSGTPVFLIDRREPELRKILAEMDAATKAMVVKESSRVEVAVPFPVPLRKRTSSMEMRVYRTVSERSAKTPYGIWLSKEWIKRPVKISQQTGCWLPPVIWPDEEKEIGSLVGEMVKKGVRQFVLNMPWQMALFDQPEDLELWAGPFCNISNPIAVDALKKAGFKGVIVGPELSGAEYAKLPGKSSLPLGIVISGNWPLCISRIASPGLKENVRFESPKQEAAWTTRHDENIWVFPNWKLDLTVEKEVLVKAGYRLLIHLEEPVSRDIALKNRPGKWNWDHGLG